MSKPNFHLNNIDTDDCPCKDCGEKRYPGCHSECVDYIMWNDEHQRKLAELQHEKDMDDIYYSGAARRNKQLKVKGVKFGRNKKPYQ